MGDSAAELLERLMGGPLTLGGALAAIRESEGESLTTFSARLGVSRTHLNDIEHGRRKISLEKAAEFAAALGHSESQLVRLVLQDQLRAARLRYRVSLEALASSARAGPGTPRTNPKARRATPKRAS